MHNQATKIKLLLILVVSALLVSVVLPVNAEYIEQQSEYLWTKIGTGGQANSQDVAGRWAMGTVIGNPETDADDNRQLNYYGEGSPAGKFGYTSVRIDEKTTIYGHTSDGGWVSPGNYAGDNFNLNSNWQHKDSKVLITFKMTVVRDVARFEYTIVNKDIEPHTVGLRLLGDTTVDSEPGVPGSGCAPNTTYPYIPGMGYPTRETDITGPQIPEWFDMYNDPAFPTVATRNLLRGQDATVPDRMAVGEWGNLIANDWDYLAIPDKPVSDWAWAVWWNPRVLAPGAQRKIVAYSGVSAASASWTVLSGTSRIMDKYCLAVQGPLALKFDATKTPQLSGENGDNKFEIKAYVYNFNTQPLTNITVNLWLPEGLRLASGSTESITVPNVSAGQESLPVKWTVYATGEVSGALEYQVTATGNPGFSQEVKRSIMIPATLISEVESGWQLLSMPFEFRNAAWDTALNFSPSIPVLDARIWDQTDQLYKPLNVLQPGKGFWLKTGASAQLTLAGEPKALSGLENYSIPLSVGWNLVGNPYVYPVHWGRLSVMRGSDIVSIEVARERQWIRQTIYWWDAPAQEYGSNENILTLLQPFHGYWIRALVDCQLLFPKVDQIGGAISNATAEALASRAAMSNVVANTKDSWRMRIVARAGNASDERNMFGVDTRAADGYDMKDVERPPSVAKFVAVTFPHRDWGTDSGNFWRDIRRSAGVQQSWDMEVSTDLANSDIVLTWPDLVDLPKDISLKLTDVDGNTVKYMRTTSSYRFNSGSSTTRKFKIVAESGKVGRLMITGLNVGKSKAIGGVTLSYALSTDASADVRIKSTFGKTVRNLAVGRGVTRGIANLSWNYRDDSGEPIPAGSYIVEVTATTPDGEVAKAVRPFMVAR